MDPISIVLGLANVLPSIVGWIGGDKAEDVASTMVDTAKRLTGLDDGHAAVAAIQADPVLQAQMQQAWQAYELALFRAEIEDRKDARARAVAQNDKSPVYIGILILLFWGAIQIFMLTATKPPAIAPELVGRILGMIDAATVGFLAWMYGTTRSSGHKDVTIQAAMKR